MLLGLFSCWFLPRRFRLFMTGCWSRGAFCANRRSSASRPRSSGCASPYSAYGSGGMSSRLVIGRLATQLVSLFASAAVARWYPRPRLTWPFAREILEFSRHILANRLIIFLRSYSGTLAIGSFLGLTEAGYYRVAERIIAAFSELIGEPARMLAWTLFRRAAVKIDANGKASRDVGASATTFMTILMAASAPIYLGLSLISSGLIDVVLGDKSGAGGDPRNHPVDQASAAHTGLCHRAAAVAQRQYQAHADRPFAQRCSFCRPDRGLCTLWCRNHRLGSMPSVADLLCCLDASAAQLWRPRVEPGDARLRLRCRRPSQRWPQRFIRSVISPKHLRCGTYRRWQYRSCPAERSMYSPLLSFRK